MSKTPQDIKNEEKAAKKLAAAVKEKAKKAQEQAGLVAEFEEKKAKADGTSDNVQKLKEWLHNPPYKCTNADVKVRNKFQFVN